MLVVLFILILCSHATPAHLAARPLRGSVGNRVSFDKELPLPPVDEADIAQEMNSRTRSGAGPYTGVAVRGLSGNVGMDDGGGYGPRAYASQESRSRGTIASRSLLYGGIDTVVPLELKFLRVPVGYQLPGSILQSIITYVRQMILIHLDSAFKLLDMSNVGIFHQNGGQIGGQNNWQDGVQNQNGQNAWNNQNGGRFNEEPGTDWASNGSGNNGNRNNNGRQNNNGWQNGGQNDGQNQNGQIWQTAWNIQNGGGNNWQNGQNGVQNQDGQTVWNNQNGNGSGAGAGGGSNGSGNGNYWNNNVGLNGGQNGAQSSGNGESAFALHLRVTVKSSADHSSVAVAYVIQAVLNGIQGITNYVRVLDVNAFSSLMLSVGAYATPMPTPMPNTPMPTRRPSMKPTPRPSLEPTSFPSNIPTPRPSLGPTFFPTNVPTSLPSPEPVSREPTLFPISPDQPSESPTADPSQNPTAEPSAIPELESSLPMQFNLDDISPDYIPSANDQESIRGFIEDMMKENVEPPLEIASISYASNGDSRHLTTTRWLKLENSLYLPVMVTLKGPSNVVKDDAYSEILDIAENNAQEIIEDLKEMDYETFKNVGVTSEALDIMDPNSPTHTITHPVQFLFNSVDVGYEFSDQDLTLCILHIEKILNINMAYDWEVVKVANAPRYKLDVPTVQLPLRITVKGPAEESGDFLTHMIEVLGAHMEDFENFLRSLDPSAFEDVSVSTESVDLPPIGAPTFASEHPVEVILNNVHPEYGFTTDIRTYVIQYVKELVKDHLDVSLELIDIEYAGIIESEYGTMKNSISLPLRITVKGESKASKETTLSVIKIVEDYNQEIKDFLISLNEDVFEEAIISAESFNFDSIIEMDIEETVHHVQIIFENAPNRYRLSATDRKSIIRFVKKTLDENLDESLGLVLVVDAGDIINAGVLSLPLHITVKGPAAEADFALAFVIDTLNDHKHDIEMLAKSLDWNELKDTAVAIETFDLALLITEAEMAKMEETGHPVQLIIENAPSGSHISQYNRASILRFVKELIEDNLDIPFLLVEVTDASSDRRRRNLTSTSIQHRRKLDTISLPLHVVVKGPSDESNSASVYVRNILEDHHQDIENFLKSLDWDLFKIAVVSIEMFDPSSITTEPFIPITIEPEAEVVDMEETEHPVQLIFENTFIGYKLSAADRASIIDYMKELLDVYLMETLEVVQVDYLGNTGEKSLSLLITVKGSADVSYSALANVMKVLQDHIQDLEMFIKSLDWIAFKNVGVSIRTYDPDSITFTPESKMVKSEHPIQLTFKNSPPGYHLTYADQESIIQFVEELMIDNLKEPFELIEVTYIGGDHHRSLLSSIFHRIRRLYDLSLPLLVAVKGPEDQSDLALANVMKVLEDHEQDIQTFAKTLDWSSFKDVSVSVSSYESNLMSTEAELELVEMETTEHPFQFTLNNVPSGYQLTPADRASFIRYIEELIDDHFDDPLELLELTYDGSDGERSLLSFMVHHTRRLDVRSLPLRITVKGPVGQSDFILSYIMAVLKEHEQDILRKLWSLDWDAFKNVGLSIPEIREMETTVHPVQLAFENVPAGYHFSATNRSSILLFVKELLEDNIDDQFQLIEVTYPGCENHSNIIGKTRGYDPSIDRGSSSLGSLYKNDNGRRLFSSRRLEASLPLQITVKGPRDLTDYALLFVTSVLEDNMQNLENKLRSLDYDAFVNVKLSASYEPDLISEPCLETVDMEDTEHRVTLTFNDVVPGYSLSADNRASIIRFVTTLLEKNLDDILELVNVVADTTRSYNRSLLSYVRRLEALYLPLLVTVRGPADESDFALSNIRAVFGEHRRDIEFYLRSLDSDAFTNSSMPVDDISDPGMPASKIIMIMDGGKEDAYWWVWILAAIGFLFLFFCICICCGCIRRYKQIKNESRKKDSDVLEKQTFDDNPVLIEGAAFYPPIQYYSTSCVPYAGMVKNNSIVSVPYADYQDESQYGSRISFFSTHNASSASSLSSHLRLDAGDVVDDVSTFAGRSAIALGLDPPEESTVLSVTSNALVVTSSHPRAQSIRIGAERNINRHEALSYPTQSQTQAADEPNETNFWDDGESYSTVPGPPGFVAPDYIKNSSTHQHGGVSSDGSECDIDRIHTFC